jgi:hypothetical protein
MSFRRFLLGPLRRVVAVVAMLGLAAGPAPLAAASTGHCGGDQPMQHRHAAGGGPTGAVTRGMGADMPGDCPHCASAECAVLSPCAGGLTAAAAAVPALVVASAVRATAAPAAAAPTSLALAPPTPPPLPIS